MNVQPPSRYHSIIYSASCSPYRLVEIGEFLRFYSAAKPSEGVGLKYLMNKDLCYAVPLRR
jgi:hypothetical protein